MDVVPDLGAPTIKRFGLRICLASERPTGHSGIVEAAWYVGFNPSVIAAMTIRALQHESIARKLTMLRSEEHLSKPLLVQISQLKCHVTELHRSICTHPD